MAFRSASIRRIDAIEKEFGAIELGRSCGKQGLALLDIALEPDVVEAVQKVAFLYLRALLEADLLDVAVKLRHDVHRSDGLNFRLENPQVIVGRGDSNGFSGNNSGKNNGRRRANCQRRQEFDRA